MRVRCVGSWGRERGTWALGQVNKAAGAFAREYHREALSQLRPVMETEAADVPEVRELYGLDPVPVASLAGGGPPAGDLRPLSPAAAS